MDELPSNFRFGGYVVRECIGRGGMARVYRAEHAALRKQVALKVMDMAWIGHAAGTQRFVGEARAAAAVKHRNVVDIVDVGVWEDRPYIVMELLDGLDLERHLTNRGPLSEREVVALALPIIAGMAAVHEEGIVHRDLKPSNIFLTLSNEGEVTPKVLDFGISRLCEHLQEPGPRPTGTREIIGTPTYMSPEALNGVRELGPAADQYSLGVVLYQCTVGRLPFQGDTLLQLLRAIALGVFPSPRAARPQLSAALDAIISRAMRVEPSERFPSLRDLGRALWPLGDERTRVIWARYFGGARSESLDKRSLERKALEKSESLNVALVRDRTRGGGERSRRALAIGLCVTAVLLTALGGRWLLTRQEASTARASLREQDQPAQATVSERVHSVQPGSSAATGPIVSPIPNQGIESRRTAKEPMAARRTRPSTAESSTGSGEAKRRSATSATHPGTDGTANEARREPQSERSVDSDLANLFELEGARKRPKLPAAAPHHVAAESGSEGELRGIFPSEGDSHSEGSNGAPILD
ncbi:MAG: hypothetical protein RL033_6076 [Pseudomonadota bacterium]